MSRQPLSLYVLLVSLVLPTIIVTLALSASFNYYQAKESILQQVDQESERSLASLNNTISGLMEAYAVNEYEHILAGEISLNQHCAIIVQDLNMGKIMGQQYITGYILKSQGERLAYDPSTVAHQDHLSNCLKRYATPILDTQNQQIGTLELYSSNKRLEAELYNTLNQSLLSALLTCFLMAMLLLILSRRFVARPLEQMMQAIANTDKMGIPKDTIPEQGPMELRALARNMNSMVTSIRLSQRDLQQQKDTVTHMTHYDALTGLANRTLFNDRLASGIARARRLNYRLALLMIDLDHFKKINDSLGHTSGDQVLTLITQRLSQLIPSDDTLARLGGDEFTIVLEGLKETSEAEELARRVLQTISEPLELDGQQLYINSSIGISLYPDLGNSATELLMQADTALNRIKQEGRNGYQLFDPSLAHNAQELLSLEARLRRALQQSELIPYFQPQINIRTGKIEGFEALARWYSAEEGLISPGRFISVAEQSGLIEPLDWMIIRKSMQHFVDWYDRGLNPGTLSVNLNIRHFQNQSLISTLESLMAESGFKAQWLEVEVTETQLMTKPEEAIQVLNKLHASGIRIALDDFGTGYSSLSYLKRLPITKLKIDQSFIRDLPDDAEDASIVRAVIGLAKNLGLEVLAEGAETEHQINFLRINQCDRVQGYFYARPMPAADALNYLMPKRVQA